MNFITQHQFLEQSEKVRNSLMDLWKPEQHDLIFDFKENKELSVASSSLNEIDLDIYINGIPKSRFKHGVIPLFTETQLRNFILLKTHGFITYSLNNSRTSYHVIIEKIIDDKLEEIVNIDANNMDLLEAYWMILIKIIN